MAISFSCEPIFSELCAVSHGGPQMVRSVSPLVDLIEDDADEQSPAGGADAEQADAGGGDDEGQQGGLTGIVVLQCGVQAAADGAEQRQPGDTGH